MARSADPTLAERRRRQILDAAMTCFSRRGFHRSSMQEICAEAALSAGALYRYFPSKSDIIAAIAEEDGRASEPLFAAIADGADLIEGLCVLAAHMIAKCGAEASLFAEVIAETLRDRELSQKFAVHEDQMRARLIAAISAAFKRRPAPDMTPEQAARIVMLMLDGLLMRILHEGVHGAVDTALLLQDYRRALVRLFAVATPPKKRALVGAEP